MSDIASLGIQITTNGVQQAASDLDKLSASGDKAATSASKLNKSFSQGQTAPIAAVTKATTEQTAALAKLAGQIDPTVAKLDKLDAMQAKLSSFKAKGLIGSDDFAALNTALDASRAKLSTAGDAVSHFTLNNSLARRELGYLAKDLATGNYGRFTQSALTLANASGVMALAFSGVGVAVLGTVAALALGVVAFAKGQAETDAFNKSLILTGGYAGKTSDQLNDMAKAMSGTVSTQHNAAAALAAVVASGKFAGTQLQVVTDAALEMEKATGQAIGETIKQFTSLADDPVKAILKLNDTQHFLTLAIFDQIQALVDQGRAQDAANLAEDTYANAIAGRTTKIEANLGTLQTAWANIKTVAASAWDTMMGIGRDMTASDRIAQLQALLVSESTPSFASPKAQVRFNSAAGHVGFESTGAEGLASSQEIQNQIDELNKLQSAKKAASDTAAQTSDTQTAQDLGIGLAQQAKQYASAEVKRQEEITKAHGDANAAIAAAEKVQDLDLRAQLIAQAKANEQAIVAGIESRDKKPKEKKDGADPFASLNGLVQKAQVFDQGVGKDKADNAQVTAILAIVDAGAKLIASGKDVAKVQAQVATGVAALNEGYAKQAAILAAENATAIKQYQASLDKQNDALQRSIDTKIASISLGSKEAAQQQQLNSLYEKSAQALTDLQLKRDAIKAKGGDTTVLDADIVALQKNIDQQVKIVTDGFVAIDAAESNGMNGVHQAIQNFMDEQKNMAGQMAQLTTSFLSGFSDAFAGFVSGTENAKKAFGGLVDSMYQQALKLVANKTIQALFDSFGASNNPTAGSTAGGWASIASNFMNALGFGGSSMSSSQSSSLSSGAGSFIDAVLNANGGVYKSSSLSAHSGQIVDKPTMFKFASGAGLMGEAGPEAILPLRRGGDGKLGIAMQGGAGRNVSVNQTIVVQGTINRRTAQQIATATAQKQRIATARNA